MKKKPELEPEKEYIVTLKFKKKGSKVQQFVDEAKKRKDWVSPWWINEKRYN